MDTVEMPDRLADDLLLFIRQNEGTLAKKRREREFKALKDEEIAQLEEVVRNAFDGFENVAHD
jgi:urease gamma subunit